MGRYWATRRAGNSAGAAPGLAGPLVISNVEVVYNAGEGVAHCTFEATRNSATGWGWRLWVGNDSPVDVIQEGTLSGDLRNIDVDMTGTDEMLAWYISIRPTEGEVNENEEFSTNFSPSA